MIEGIGLGVLVWLIVFAVFGLLGVLERWRYGRPVKLYPMYCAWCKGRPEYWFPADWSEVKDSTALCPLCAARLRRQLLAQRQQPEAVAAGE